MAFRHEDDPKCEIRIGSYSNTVRIAGLFRDRPMSLMSGASLSPVDIAYETWGVPDPSVSNAILLIHALTGDSHAASHFHGDRAGWFEGMIGPGRALDPSKHFIVCANWIGSNYGSTGPVSVNPATGKPYRGAFPQIFIPDITRTLKALSDHLGVSRWKAAIGGSIGGFIVLDLAARFPAMLDCAIPMASAMCASPWVIAFHEIMRRILSIGMDSGSEELLRRSLEVARMVGIATYRSRQEFMKRYQRDRAELQWQDKGCQFAVESYLRYQGMKLDNRFDPITYEYLTRAADSFDLAEIYGSLELAASRIKCRTLCVGIDTDYLFPLEEQREIVNTLRRGGSEADLAVISSDNGHDGFLIEFEQLNAAIGGVINQLPGELR